MSNAHPSGLLRIRRLDFHRLRGESLFEALESASKGVRVASPLGIGLLHWMDFLGQVENGGLVQYFYNRGDAAVQGLRAVLDRSRQPRLARILSTAARIFRRRRAEFRTFDTFGPDGLFARMTELKRLDGPLEAGFDAATARLETWFRSNVQRLAVDESGCPIDPRFSGEIETRHPDGQLRETAGVLRGRIHGPYRRYSPGGAIEREEYYDKGKVSADYWPNGQIKRRELRRGGRVIHEWYYPSGTVQKRLVSGSRGQTEGVVRLWHENGRVAEECRVRRGKLSGPWVKFFEDGSPRLRAEHRTGEMLIVFDAWNEKRRRIVKSGRGTYVDDGLSVNWPYDLHFKHDWIHSRQLRNGLPHGQGVTWHAGTLWSKESFVRGRREGWSTTYYDNGRPRSRTLYRRDKAVKELDFPKFDRPRPAVLIRLEADARLYEAWGQPRPDVFPSALNLQRVQATLRIPPFLEDVRTKNETGEAKGTYDDLNTFSDSAGYMLQIDARGRVRRVSWTGASAYSGAVIGVYPPYLRRLKFRPARLGGRCVSSRVFASVDHTFVEGA